MVEKRIYTDQPSPEALTAMGEVTFLAARCKQHAALPVAALRRWWEMPVLLGQSFVFRHEGAPRLAISWAALSPEAEHRYIVAREGLRPEDWRSGRQIWVIDWISPFQMPQLNAYARRWLVTTGFKDVASVRFARMSKEGHPRVILELQRDSTGRLSRRILSPTDFEKGQLVERSRPGSA